MGLPTAQLPQAPFKTPLLQGKADLIDQTAWLRWLTLVMQGLNQQAQPVTVAGLPSAPTIGMVIPVTDATATGWGTTVAGGGALFALVTWNGTNWTVVGK